MATNNYTPPSRAANSRNLEPVPVLDGTDLKDARDQLGQIKAGVGALRWALENLQNQIENLEAALDPAPLPRGTEVQS